MLKTTFKFHSKVGVGTTNVFIRFHTHTAVIDKLIFYCWVPAHILENRFHISVKAPPKRRNARLLH